MTGQELWRRRGNVVIRQANERNERRPEKTSVLTTRTPTGVTRLSMYVYASTALSGYDCGIGGRA